MTKQILIESCSDCPYCSWYPYVGIKHNCILTDSWVTDEVYYQTVLEDCPLEDYYSGRG